MVIGRIELIKAKDASKSIVLAHSSENNSHIQWSSTVGGGPVSLDIILPIHAR